MNDNKMSLCFEIIEFQKKEIVANGKSTGLIGMQEKLKEMEEKRKEVIKGNEVVIKELL